MKQDHTMFGVHGVLEKAERPDGLLGTQEFVARRKVQWEGEEATCVVEVRFDDNCGNGRQYFYITGNLYHGRNPDSGMCGCLHKEVAEYFPELAHLIRWHGVGTEGPMHGVANALYHAGDVDHNGLRKGEPRVFNNYIRFGGSPVLVPLKPGMRKFIEEKAWLKKRSLLAVVPIEYVDKHGKGYDFGPKYDFAGRGVKEWHLAYFETKEVAESWAAALLEPNPDTDPVEFVDIPTQFSEGKERDFDAARSCAVWPEATDEQLSRPKDELRKLLEARLPGLLAEFRKEMDACGFEWRELGVTA